MKAPFRQKVFSRYGAPMGRHSDTTIEGKVRLVQVPMVDGDYDPGGAYWGGYPSLPLFCAYNQEATVYLRARSLEEAKAQFPGCVFVSEPMGLDALPEFVDAYLTAALWSSTDDEGDPLDANYSADDLGEGPRAKAEKDCAAFIQANAEDLADLEPGQAGHDFWLTRNRHGAGFLDRGLGELGDRLTKSAQGFGEVYLYVGDDGRLYF